LAEGLGNQIHDLSINDNKITAEGIKELVKFTSLMYLNAAGNSFTDSHIPLFQNLNPKLKFLCLSRNFLTDLAVVELSQLKHLETLMLDRNPIRK
jgi:Leucine-rich repeat (LRR) protein